MSFCPIKLHLSFWWTGTNVIYETSPPFSGRVVLRWFPGHKYPGDNNTTTRRNVSLRTVLISLEAQHVRRANLGQELNQGCKLPVTGSVQWNNARVSKQSFSGHFCSKWLVERCTGTNALEPLVIKGTEPVTFRLSFTKKTVRIIDHPKIIIMSPLCCFKLV